MKLKTLRIIAIFLILEVGLVHYFSSQHEFEEAWILGYLFIANFLGGLVAAYGIYRQKAWGWGLGVLVSLGSLVGYVWSRTTGLPYLPPEEWLYPWGVTSILSEGLFILIVPLYAWASKGAEEEAVDFKWYWRSLVMFVGVLALAAINYSTHRMDVLYPQLDHEHVFFLWQVRLQPELSSQQLEEEYGLQVSRAAVTGMGGIVDVRMRVVDREKAEQLIEDGHFALLVGDTLIPAPHVSRHMLKNKTIIVMFPNINQTVKGGSPVSIVFENLRAEPINTSY